MMEQDMNRDEEKKERLSNKIKAEISASSHTEKHGVVRDEKKGEVKKEHINRDVLLKKAVGAKQWIRRVVDKTTGKVYKSKEE